MLKIDKKLYKKGLKSTKCRDYLNLENLSPYIVINKNTIVGYNQMNNLEGWLHL